MEMDDSTRRPHPLIVSSFISKQYWSIRFEHPIISTFKTCKANYIKEGGVDASKYHLFVKSSEGEEIQCGTITQPNIEQLLQHSSPSSFGRGEETVYDENVRKGREIKSDLLSLKSLTANGEYESFDNAFLKTKREIHEELFPTARKIKLGFNKLTIYEPGGHFSTHKDTARSHNHQGTLLIEVRTPHTGGNLVLEHNGQTNIWSLENEVRETVHIDNFEDIDDNFVHWIAFHTDVNHRVEPVTSGVRMTLQFDIFVTPEDQEENPMKKRKGDSDSESDDEVDYDDDDDGDDDEYNEKFFGEVSFRPVTVSNAMASELLQHLSTSVTNKESIALPLFHFYSNAKVTPELLKVRDRQLFDLLLDAGYCLQLLHINIFVESNVYGKFPRRIEDFGFSMYDVEQIVDENSSQGYVKNNDSTTSSTQKYRTVYVPEELSVTYLATGFHRVVLLSKICHIHYAAAPSTPDVCEYLGVAIAIHKMTEKVPKEKKDDDDESDEN